MTVILDLDGLRSACKSGRRFRYRPFYGHTARADGQLSDAVFSQFWPCSFVLGAQRYRLAEQWMMASKARLFGDAEACQSILRATAPLEYKRIGRTVRGFDDARWQEHRFELVTAGNVAKFEQDPALAAYLLASGEDVLVEASPRDRIWGVGLGRNQPAVQDPLLWRGQNLLGFALVRTRAILRGELPRPSLPALFESV